MPFPEIQNLWKRCNQAWDEGREAEADAMMFELYFAIIRAGQPDEWDDVFLNVVAKYCAILFTSTDGRWDIRQDLPAE
jgi:hypothetical protein